MTKMTPLGRFMKRIIFLPSGCWEWQGAIDGHGYGVLWNGHRLVGAHRFSYQQLVGAIPEGMVIDHLCRNSRCVNPKHLEVVTHHENQMRGKMGVLGHWNLAKTHCPHGHQYSRENTYIFREKNGGLGRMCRICMKIRDAKKKTKKRAPPVSRRRFAEGLYSIIYQMPQ